MRALLRLLWGIGRLPLLLLAALLLHEPILSAIEAVFDIDEVTLFAIDVLSTPALRICILAGLFLGLLAVTWIARRMMGPGLAYIATLAAAFVMFAAIMYAVSMSKWLAFLPLLLVATNLAPVGNRVSRARGRFWDRLMMFGVGLAELLFFGRYLRWLRGGSVASGKGSSGLGYLATQAMPGLLFASVLTALMVDGHALVPLEQKLRSPASVRVVAREDFNWIELDSSDRYLFATGHGVRKLRRYDVEQWSAPYLEAERDTGWAQGFAYDDRRGEIYVYNSSSETLMYLDGSTLSVIREVPVADLSPGDPWVLVDRERGLLTIASEADQQNGYPLVVLDRESGRVLHRRREEAGNLLAHPSKPILYLSFFRRTNGLLAYDPQTNRILARTGTPDRLDRLAYLALENEVLVASPLAAEVLRFDADSLEPKGRIGANFGVRVMAIDATRRLMLTGSLATGTVAVIDLETGRRVKSFYLGPWLRTIVVSEPRGVAYVSSNGALYELAYAQVD